MRLVAVVVIFLTLPLQGCFANWSKKDKKLFSSFAILQGIDYAQYDKSNEANQLFDGANQNTVGLVKLAGVGLVYVLASYWEDARTQILIGVNVVSGGVVIWNTTKK